MDHYEFLCGITKSNQNWILAANHHSWQSQYQSFFKTHSLLLVKQWHLSSQSSEKWSPAPHCHPWAFMLVTGANDLCSDLRYSEDGQSALVLPLVPDHTMGHLQRPLNYDSFSSGTQRAITFKTVTPGVLPWFQELILKISEGLSPPSSGIPHQKITIICERLLFFQNP